MDTRKATVSVVIPAYNREHLIIPTLDSVGNQTQSPLEILVIDDRSTDSTAEVLDQYAKDHPHLPLRYFIQSKNQGVSAARNRGIREASGEWIAFLDSDDLWEANHLAGLIGAQSLNGADVVFSRVRGFSDDDERAAEKTWTSRFACTDDLLRDMISACHILPSAAMVRRELLLSAGLFDETPAIQHAEDWDLWLRFIENGAKFHMHDGYSCRYRQHANSACSNKSKLYRAVLHCLNKHPRFPLSSKAQWNESISYFRCKLARALFESAQRGSGSEFFRAWRNTGLLPKTMAAGVLCSAASLVTPLRPITLAFLRRYF